MKKLKLSVKLLLPMVMMLFMSNSIFSQAVNVNSISDGHLFVLTIPKDVAKETEERVVSSNFIKLEAEKFDVKKLSSYAVWSFKSIRVTTSNNSIKTYYAIYNANTHQYLRYSNKDRKPKLVDEKDFDEIWKRKSGTASNEYVYSFKDRMSFYFIFTVKDDFVGIYRYTGENTYSQLGPMYWSAVKVRLILVEYKK
jgi:hypothetical protein